MKSVRILILFIIGILIGTGFFSLYKNKNFNKLNSDSKKPDISSTITPNFNSTYESIMEDWLLFESEKYKFSLKYPQDIKHQTTTEGENFLKLGPTQSLGTELYDGISLTIVSGSLSGMTFEKYVESEYQKTKKDPVNPRLSQKREIEVAGIKGIAYEVDSLGKRTIIYLPRDVNEYILIMNGTVAPGEREQVYQQVVDLMLSTLEF